MIPNNFIHKKRNYKRVLTFIPQRVVTALCVIPERPEVSHVRLAGFGRVAIIHRVLSRLHDLLRHEGRRLLGAELSHVRHGQRYQERR